MNSLGRRGPAHISRLRLSLGLILLAAGCLPAALSPIHRPAGAHVVRARYLMGTVLEIDAAGGDRGGTEAAVALAFAAVERTEERLSNWRRNSELSRANREAGSRPVVLSPATFRSLEAAFGLARETGGAFDPSVGGVTEALGLTGRKPNPERARELAATVGWRGVHLDAPRRALSFESRGTEIDSGGFGKGEALDRAAAALRRRGVEAARLNFGGQILLFGVGRPAGRGFSEVSIAAPDDSSRVLCRFKTRDGSVSTSGDAEKPGHILDPRTGRPAPFHGSVTVIADTGLRSDALSTALFVMGPREGLLFAQSRGIPALFVIRRAKGFSIVSSRAFPRLSKRSF